MTTKALHKTVQPPKVCNNGNELAIQFTYIYV